MGHATPEEAARGDIPEYWVRVIGVVVRGNQAVVAQITNADGYPAAYEVDTAQCHLDSDGWRCGSSGNGTGSSIRTGKDSCTVVWWREAPEGATAARLRLGEAEQLVPVDEGFVFAVFDDVPFDEAAYPRPPRRMPGGSAYARRWSWRRPKRPRFTWPHQWPEVEGWV